MSWYRRRRQPGGTFFFTLVAFGRRPILTTDTARTSLHHAWIDTQKDWPFETLAVVLLPNHLHCIWKLPPKVEDYSTRWQVIKTRFSDSMIASGYSPPPASPSRARRRERGILQRRFWEHEIRNEQDLKRHVDYIHYNPVKHGYAQSAGQWLWSTFEKFRRLGEYEDDWGQAEPELLKGWTVDHDEWP